MTILSFPTLPGQGFAIKRPITSGVIASHDSGREARTPIYNGLYEFEVSFDGLASDSTSNPGLSAQSLQALMGLYLQCGGAWGTFLYTDPNDNSVTAQQIATGDGMTTLFTLGRSIPGTSPGTSGFDTDFDVTSVTAVTVNSAAASGWSLITPNQVSFSSAPAAGAAIAATFTFAFVCRFLDDAQEFENFMQNLWAARSLKFRSVRQ